jgi:hypothetical protein
MKSMNSTVGTARAKFRVMRAFWAVLLVGLGASGAWLAWAADYSIDWFTIDGGGGTSTGGGYTGGGPIGQPDAGRMSGGPYTLDGGFWGVVAAIQTPGGPLLSVSRTNGAVMVSWPKPADGWVLEQTNQITGLPGAWPQVPLILYKTNATDIYFVEPAPIGNRFYRLHKP